LAARNHIVDSSLLSIGRITLDCERGQLHLDGEVVALRPQSFKVLRILIENRDRLVPRERLLRDVWQDRIVTDDSLVQCLVDIRRALSGIDSRVVLTLPGRGYLFQSDRVAGNKHRLGAFALQPRARIAAAFATMVVALVLVLRSPLITGPVPVSQANRPSIAVLPFVDLTEGQDKRFLAEGLSEEILNQLAASDDLKVIARTSSFSFRGDDTDLETIAEKLAVSHILEGSIRQSDDRLRVSVQLIDTTDNSNRWSQTYDRSLGDILDVQLDIAQSVAGALNTVLDQRDNYDQGANPYAHALVIQAQSELRLRDRESNAHVQRLLRHALEIDPDNVSALAVLAVAVRQSGHPRGSDAYHAAWRQSIGLTNRALALNPDHPSAVAQRGWIELYYYKDYFAAARSIERAVALDATNPEVIRLATNALMVFGQPRYATRLGQHMIDRDPLCITCQGFQVMTAAHSGDFELAEKTARRLLELNPDYLPGYELLGNVLLSKGEPAAALRVFQNRTDENAGILFSKAVAHYQLGQLDEFARLRQRLIDLHKKSNPSYIAQLEAFSGNIDAAFAWLDKQLDKPRWARSVNYRSEYYENLRDDPRWDEYLTEFGVSPEQLARIDFSPTLPF